MFYCTETSWSTSLADQVRLLSVLNVTPTALLRSHLDKGGEEYGSVIFYDKYGEQGGPGYPPQGVGSPDP